jgi:hypothetical protein
MITANDWWSILQHYNVTVFPAQIVLYVLALAAVGSLILLPEGTANRIIKAYFVGAFGWIAVVFFLTLGHDLPAYQAQTVEFVTLTGLFLTMLFTGDVTFRLPDSDWRRAATLGGFGLVLAYPLYGLLMGHPVSKLIVPGSFPCPTTALALVCFSTALPEKRRWLYFATLFFLLLWAIPFPLLIQIPKFGAYEDAIMVLMGVYALGVIVARLRGGATSRPAPAVG